MAAKKTIFHQIISCKNTLHGVSKEAKRRRKIRTILKLYNIWHKKVGTKLFSSSLKKRQFTSSKNALFSLKFEVFFDDFQTVSQMRVKVWKWLPVNLEKSELDWKMTPIWSVLKGRKSPHWCKNQSSSSRFRTLKRDGREDILADHKCEIWFVQTFTAQTNEEEWLTSSSAEALLSKERDKHH